MRVAWSLPGRMDPAEQSFGFARVKEEKEKVENFFERKLEEWLSQKAPKPNLRSFGRKENSLEKRAEILKKEDIMIHDY